MHVRGEMLFSYSRVLQKEAGCKESQSRLVAEALVKHAQAKEMRGSTSEHRLTAVSCLK